VSNYPALRCRLAIASEYFNPPQVNSDALSKEKGKGEGLIDVLYMYWQKRGSQPTLSKSCDKLTMVMPTSDATFLASRYPPKQGNANPCEKKNQI
jgi:hypothetical protein